MKSPRKVGEGGLGNEDFRTADVGARDGGRGGIRLPPGMKGKGNL